MAPRLMETTLIVSDPSPGRSRTSISACATAPRRPLRTSSFDGTDFCPGRKERNAQHEQQQQQQEADAAAGFLMTPQTTTSENAVLQDRRWSKETSEQEGESETSQRLQRGDSIMLPKRAMSPTRQSRTAIGIVNDAIDIGHHSPCSRAQATAEPSSDKQPDSRTTTTPEIGGDALIQPIRHVSFDGYLFKPRQQLQHHKRCSSFEGIISGILKKPEMKEDDDNRIKPPKRRVSFEDVTLAATQQRGEGNNLVKAKLEASSLQHCKDASRVPWWKKQSSSSSSEYESCKWGTTSTTTPKKPARRKKKKASMRRNSSVPDDLPSMQDYDLIQPPPKPKRQTSGGRSTTKTIESNFDRNKKTNKTMKRSCSTPDFNSQHHKATSGPSTQGEDIVNLVKMLAERAVITIKQNGQ